ncbi:probable serine hydrolase [Thrips palmi]|uniref:Probable serine hydrolase n=1 Tax=Thrips palmi TaxID=161013 RepID=A0A6P8ZU29_THRPL|nr:probable serine hydrolase [Thrips palmi]
MLFARTARGLVAGPASSTEASSPLVPLALVLCRGKATAAQPRPRHEQDEDVAGQRAAGTAARASSQYEDLLAQLQEREVRIPVPWGHIAGKWWGRTDRRPLVALHGWGDNAGSFERLAGSLRGVPVLALDLPGHGLSSRVPRGVAPADRGLLLTTLRRVQRALGLTTVSLVGHSLGDAVALIYAATYPTDVDMYVSLDTLVPAPADADAELKASGPLVDELLDAEERMGKASNDVPRAQLLDDLLAGRGGSLNRHAAETLLRRGAEGSGASMQATVDPRVMRAPLLPAALALACARSVRCPALAVLPQWRGPRALSADEELRERFLADLRMASKTVTTVTVNGTHHVHLNSPEVVVPALNEFLDQHRQADAKDHSVQLASFFV